jgi:hypothetical protein
MAPAFPRAYDGSLHFRCPFFKKFQVFFVVWKFKKTFGPTARIAIQSSLTGLDDKTITAYALLLNDLIDFDQ